MQHSLIGKFAISIALQSQSKLPSY